MLCSSDQVVTILNSLGSDLQWVLGGFVRVDGNARGLMDGTAIYR
jgi:hypothetical protein